MYNLLVSGWSESWNGEPFTIERARCISNYEYTDADVAGKYADWNDAVLAELMSFPSIFAYETQCNRPPHFGVIKEITHRQKQVRIEYELVPVQPFLQVEHLVDKRFDFDIGEWEMNRTHWALKDVNLPKELQRYGISLPGWTNLAGRSVDITKHHFQVGLSFPGEARGVVEGIARELESRMGPNSYFYDNNYIPQLARPSLDTLLQDIYRNRCKLIVVFIGADYQRKDWCGIEWRAIREILLERRHEQIMFIRVDDGEVDGVFRNDGYVDARHFSVSQLADFIQQRASL
ncbi:MAG: TIR domain-containing protein [Pseudorhizobium pelagicum]|uniref:TIR domain-containing protein n=1 Tax=Pseudorhizobium pelagicum TaxID=1509405 RepID=UPI00345F6816